MSQWSRSHCSWQIGAEIQITDLTLLSPLSSFQMKGNVRAKGVNLCLKCVCVCVCVYVCVCVCMFGMAHISKLLHDFCFPHPPPAAHLFLSFYPSFCLVYACLLFS